MKELMEFLDKTLSDEAGAQSDYKKMIEIVTKAEDIDDYIKVLVVSMLKKIDMDEQSHHMMLSGMQAVIKDIAESKGIAD